MQVYGFAHADDGLFIKLGQSLAEGKWLGSFDQFTLVKGPGFPAFLAVNKLIGIPITLSVALFHCIAITIFVIICNRFIRNCLISAILFTLLLWHSSSFDLRRVLREDIYYAQTLLVLGLMVWVLFCPIETHSRRRYAVAAGATLGWFWLTREEGVWIFPGLALMVFVALLRIFHNRWDMLRHPRAALRDRALRGLAVALTIAIGTFASMQIAFYSANFLAYGRFMGVDLKDSNFQHALRAIDSVRSGGTKPFVSITYAAMQRVESVSPAFASLVPYFDGPGKGWEVWGCRFHASACGEIGAGWFLWALRDAVSSAGHYSSPSAASAFFGRLANEISAACNAGKLECKRQLIAEMPPVRWAEVFRRMLPRYAYAFHRLLNQQRYDHLRFHHDLIWNSETELARALRFLNYPLHSPSIKTYLRDYTLSGWYYKSKDEWITVEIRTPVGDTVDYHFERQNSPDLAQYFKDPEASRQRFSLAARCNDSCKLILRNAEGAITEKSFSVLRGSPMSFKLDNGQAYIDRTSVLTNPEYILSPIDQFCRQIRAAIVAYYNFVFLPILVIGLIAFLVLLAVYPKRALWNVCFVVATVCWVLLVEYVSLLILIDSTSFPTVSLPSSRYLSPCCFLMISGAVLSIGALLQVSGHLPIPKRKFVSDHATGPNRTGG
jgi:hypothetical protein